MSGDFSRRAFLRGGLGTAGFAAFATGSASAVRKQSNTLRVESDGGGHAAYEFTVSGSVRQEDSGDVVRGNRAYGHVGPKRGSDTFSYSGQLTGFVLAGPATTYRNGSRLNAGGVPHPSGSVAGSDFPSVQGTNTIRIESEGGGIAVYEFGVTGSLSQVDSGDQVRGNRGYGHVGPKRGTDEFRYTGNVSAFSLAGPATVLHNGSEVRPSGQPGSGGGNQGGGNQGGGGQNGGTRPDHELCIHAPNDRLYPYQFAVGGSIDKLDASKMASIDSNVVTSDAEDDVDDCSVNGFTRGAWDCYAFTGDLRAFSVPEQWMGKYEIRFDGSPVGARQLFTSKDPSEVSCGGGGRPDCDPIRNDVMLVLDRSNSMTDQAGKFNQAKTGAINLIDLLARNDRVGLVSFATGVRLDSSLTGNFGRVQSLVRGLDASGDTNLGGGVARARTELTSNGRQNANKIMVVLADGEHNTGSHGPIPAANDAKSANVRVMTIGIPRLRDRSQLQRMASSPRGSNFVKADSVKEINDAFDTIAQEICQ
ncbi:vWA domain-containing protein [Halorussus salinisoli]|uniref:vWA domain-containing protein n=1 Tax=Halorussus salinisoli TaxID=2558242 RepID=UPI001484F88B|nr:VWA domain-containing protein [Halorussus salinisoli]